MPKSSGFRVVADDWAASQLVEQTSIIMILRFEEIEMLLGGVEAFCMLDMIQEYW